MLEPEDIVAELTLRLMRNEELPLQFLIPH